MSERGAFVAAALALAAACNPFSTPPRGPEAACVEACTARSGCAAGACARGCNLVVDRLVQHDGESVMACVASSRSTCDDRTWARCASRVGPYADGGPPAPAPAPVDDE